MSDTFRNLFFFAANRARLFFLALNLLLMFFSSSLAADNNENLLSNGSKKGIVLSYALPEPFRVYLPYSYFDGNEFPVLYLLHGQGQSEKLWEDLGIVDILDDLISRKEISPLIVVMPRESYYYQDMDESVFPYKVLDVLIPVIDNSFKTIKLRSARAIGGISRGALWAQKIAVENMDLFSSVGAHSLPNPFFSDYMFYKYLSMYKDFPQLEFYIDTGNMDPYAKGSLDFSSQLFLYKTPHTLIVSEGDHDEEYWSAHIADYLIWYDSHLFAGASGEGGF